MDEGHDVFKTADHVHHVIRNQEPRNAIEAGIADAAFVLKDRGDLDFADETQALSFARSVHDVLVNVEAQGTDLSEGPRDVTRGVLAAWSLDQVREFNAGREVPEDHDRFLRDIGALDGPIPAVEDGVSILDGRVWGATRDAVLANASVPSELRDGEAAWEIRLDQEGRTDETRGFPPMGGSRGMDASEIEDVAMEAAVDAVNAREERYERIVLKGVPSIDAAVLLASDARRSFPARIGYYQEGLLAAEGWMEGKLERPLRHEEREMGEAALARVIERPDAHEIKAKDAARIILLDMSIQMAAARTVQDRTYGAKAYGLEQPFDVVMSAAAGIDLFSNGVSAPSASTDRMAEGCFHAIPDAELRSSIMQGLLHAREPFSKKIENELGIKLAVQKGRRDRAMSILEVGAEGLKVTRSVARGVEDGAPLLGAYVQKDRGR